MIRCLLNWRATLRRCRKACEALRTPHGCDGAQPSSMQAESVSSFAPRATADMLPFRYKKCSNKVGCARRAHRPSGKRHCRRTATTERCPPANTPRRSGIAPFDKLMLLRQARALRHPHTNSIGERWFRRNLPTSFLLLLCAYSATAAGLSTEERDVIYRELQEPIQVKLVNKRTIPGHSINVSGEEIQIGTSEGAGEIIYTFQTNEVHSFKIPGDSYKTVVVEWIEAGETEKAIELLKLLYQQRVQLIPLLPASESNFFTYYVDLILESDNPARAIAITEILRPQIENPAAIRALDDAILESYYTLELYDQATPLAVAWVEQRSAYERSALGYYVLSADALRKEAYDEAIDLALQPIVFSSPITTEKIAHCYAVAISAALGLRDKDYAATLYREMLERDLSWPENDKTLAPFHKTILEQTTDV